MTTLQQTMQPVTQPSIHPSRQTRSLFIWSGKGGVGKTTASQNIAWWLAAAGKKVVLIDMDSHPTASNYIDMRVLPKHQRFTLTHVVQFDKKLLDAMYQVRRGLWVVPSDTSIEAANGYILANEAQEIMIDRVQELTAALAAPPQEPASWHQQPRLAPDFFPLPAPAQDILERPPYLDYLIFDFGVEAGSLGKAILRIPNGEIWAPVLLEPLPLQAFAQMKDQINRLFKHAPERRPSLEGIIPFGLTHKRKETVEEYVKLYLAHQGKITRCVHEDLNIPSTQNYLPARSIYECNPQTRGGRELFEIAMRIDRYPGCFRKSPPCKHCKDIEQWLSQQKLAG